ncbi:uncharacterized protein LOC143693912 [Agelaius phoeniceus]|uniref:uncharacterized protein LOC143693912 n=1 Tax=Agelaius phoeniceus TaxID=39638 RepID=UPI004054DECA
MTSEVFNALWDHFFLPVMQQRHGTAVPTPAGSSQARSSREIDTRGSRLSQAGLLQPTVFSSTCAATSLGWSQTSCMIFFSEHCKQAYKIENGDIITLLLKSLLRNSTTS